MILRDGLVLTRLAPLAQVRAMAIGFLVLMASTASALESDHNGGLPRPDAGTGAKVGQTAAESSPGRIPGPPQAPKGAPNIVIVLLDDVGFGSMSAFGGPVPTPIFDGLARDGLKYNAFHTTALCSPTRAALLTGRNHHEVGSGSVTELATAFDGYTSVIPRSAATVAEILRQHGYNTAAFGKWHNTPPWETSAAGPFDRWPTGMGFEYFYGFNAGETHQYHPALFENTVPIEARYRPGETLTNDLTAHAITWINRQKAVSPEKPFLVYFAPGAVHAPHHVAKEWSERFHGKFDQGWDKLREEIHARQLRLGIIPPGTKLTPRPKEIPSWASLSPEQRRIGSRLMEVFAGFLAETDHEVGRLVAAVRSTGQWDNTLFLYVAGDNGASGEGSPHGVFNEMSILNGVPEDPKFVSAHLDEVGGPKAHNHYPVGFAWALDTPFQWTKQVASHFGGTRNGLVITWPRAIRDHGGLRPQFHHVVDIAPTLLDAAGIKAPSSVNGIAQKPLDGVSMVYSFASATTPTHHPTQYFEMFANRAIYDHGWIASVFHGRAPWTFNPARFEDEHWELYDTRSDFSQAVDLAAKQPAKLQELRTAFDAEARRHQVYPLDDRGVSRIDHAQRPELTGQRRHFVYRGSTNRIPESAAPDTKNKSFRIIATITVPEAGASGVIAAIGGTSAGWSFFLKDSQPAFTYNFFGTELTTIESKSELTPGTHRLRFEFAYDGGGPGKGGTGRLFVDDAAVATGRIPRTVPGLFSADETFDVGIDTGSPVGDYEAPFPFTGTLTEVTIDLNG